MAFVRALPEDELWIGELRGIELEGQPVLLVRLEEGVCAYQDRCAHLGLPLSTGTLASGVLTCAAHHFQYDARTGAGIKPRSARLVPLPCRVAGGDIWVEVRPSGSRGEAELPNLRGPRG